MLFSTHRNVDYPSSLYAASKKSDELMAYTYGHRYNLAAAPIQVFNYGKHRRDFNYINDIVEGVLRVLDRPAPPSPDWNSTRPDPGTSQSPCRVYNISNNSPVELMDHIAELEKALAEKVGVELLPLQAGDVPDTCASVENLVERFHYKSSTTMEEGINRFGKCQRNYVKA